MSVTRHKRQILLFLLAVLVPAGLLIGLATRNLLQDRELAETRAAAQRRSAASQLKRELIARLDAVRLREINRLIRDPHAGWPLDFDNPAVVFLARLEGNRLVMPWESAPRDDSPKFALYRQQGERQEYAGKNLGAAADAFRQARSVARGPAESGEAELLLARVLAKAGKAAEAQKLYRALLANATGARDSEGVGYRFYAAERLLESNPGDAAVKEFLRTQANSTDRLSMPELYMIRTLLGGEPAPEFAGRIASLEQALSLAKDLPRLRALMEAGASWVPYGTEPWLIHVAPAAPPLPGLLLVVSPAKMAPPGVKLLARASQGDELGAEFPGLRVVWAENALEPVRLGVPVGFWIAGLALVLGLAFFGGYLLLRDVNRDVHMTEVRSQFVASVSHELKTPLTAIRMYAETLSLGRSRDEKARTEYLETIVNESERLARLVDNVLDFSKIEQGKKLYRPCPMRLEEVAQSAMRALQFPLAQQGFHLRLSMADDLPELYADPDAMQQAILNLLTNAMKYSGESREIELRLRVRGGDALIEVADQGLGLGPEEQKHIFDKFYRAPSHAEMLIAGTGLGLTLVAHIVKAHGGRVEVQSALGTGSTFSLIIPVGANMTAART